MTKDQRTLSRGGVHITATMVCENSIPWTWRPPSRSHYNFWVALEGEGVFGDGPAAQYFSPGTVYVFRPHEPVAGEAAAGVRLVNFAMHLRAGNERAGKWMDQLADRISGSSFGQVGWLNAYCRYLATAYAAVQGGANELGLAGLHFLVEALGLERRSPLGDRRSRIILELASRIRRNPAAHYTVDELAREAGLSAVQFRRNFRSLTGMTPHRFLVRERLARAEELLRDSHLPVGEVAARLGYADIYFFSRQFRSYRGMSPSMFRLRPDSPLEVR